MEEETKKGEKITRKKKSLKNRSGGRTSKAGRTTEARKPMCSCVVQLN